MLMCYMMSCLPLVVGLYAWAMDKRIVWWEWVTGSALGLFVTCMIHLAIVSSMTMDYETLSGQVGQVTHYPTWVEKYRRAVYNTSFSSGTYRDTFSHYETRYRTHRGGFLAEDTLGNRVYISQEDFHRLAGLFGGSIETVYGNKRNLHSGDPNIYVAKNQTGHMIPTTMVSPFRNRAKTAPKRFSFVKVPEGVELYPYPKNENEFQSDRLVGEAPKVISRLLFDCMNSRIGPRKNVNVVLVAFPPGAGEEMGQYLRSSWYGGKRNDLVIAYGGDLSPGVADWCLVFGWTEKDLCKRSLENIVVEATKIDDSILPKIEREIEEGYEARDWSEFDDIPVEPPAYAYWLIFLVMLVTQAGFWMWAYLNGEDKKR